MILPPGDATNREILLRYNRQSEVIRMTDQRGVIHDYGFDALGRWIEDRITTLPSGVRSVSGSIRRIEFEFDARGRLLYVNSYAALTGTTPANGILYAYNFFDQVTNEYQNHSGLATTGSPRVAYARVPEFSSANAYAY